MRVAYAGVQFEFDPSNVVGFLAGSINYLKGARLQPASPGSNTSGPLPISDVRKNLADAPIPKDAQQLTVEGTFFPAVLMYAGWWERERARAVQQLNWHDDLQSWLFTGFEQWGPSWNFSPLEEKDAWILGQIGEGDEANSLPVIVPPDKAGPIHEEFARGRRVFKAMVSGSLCHREHLEGKYKLRAQRWGEAFDYFIKLDADNRSHHIDPLSAPPGMYSGYLWQCLAPSKWVETPSVGTAFSDGSEQRVVIVRPPRIEKVYFLWEHTDFTKRDAVDYNLDSLQHKKEYLEKLHGPLVLLQKSSDFIAGDQCLDREIFYRYVTEVSAEAD